MAFIIIMLDAIAGGIVALLYYPSSPLYVFHGARFEEVWLWSKYSAFLAAILFILALLSIDTDFRGRDLARNLAAFVAVLQGILNLPPAIMYIVFLHGSAIAKITTGESTITISFREMLIHVAVIVISWMVAAWLALDNKKRELSDALHLMDAQV